MAGMISGVRAHATDEHATDEHAVLFELLLRLGDDHLILGHRLSQWCGHAPMLEEDLALANMGLDLIGQARALYQYAGEVEGAGRSEDDLAYLRSDREYKNVLLVERPNGDFAHTMLRQLYFAAYMTPFWKAASSSSDAQIAGIAAKAAKEMAYHLRHSAEWIIRLGDGTDASAERAAAAVTALHGYIDEMFESDALHEAAVRAGIVPDPASLRVAFDASVSAVFVEANLEQPSTQWPQSGGRSGHHGEEFGHLLAELQYLQRTYPGASW